MRRNMPPHLQAEWVAYFTWRQTLHPHEEQMRDLQSGLHCAILANIGAALSGKRRRAFTPENFMLWPTRNKRRQTPAEQKAIARMWCAVLPKVRAGNNGSSRRP